MTNTECPPHEFEIWTYPDGYRVSCLECQDRFTIPRAPGHEPLSRLLGLYLSTADVWEGLDHKATPQGVLDALQDSFAALAAGLQVARDLAAMSTEVRA